MGAAPSVPALVRWLKVEPGKKVLFGFAAVLVSAVFGDQLVPVLLLLLGGAAGGAPEQQQRIARGTQEGCRP